MAASHMNRRAVRFVFCDETEGKQRIGKDRTETDRRTVVGESERDRAVCILVADGKKNASRCGVSASIRCMQFVLERLKRRR